MIDIYGTIAVGCALLIGIIPLMSKKLRGHDFLISYVEPKYGSEETKYRRTTPGEDAMKHLKPTRNSVLKIVTHNFPKQVYNSAAWNDKLREWKNNGVEIRILGGPNMQARHSVEVLIKEGIIKVKQLKKPLTYHLNIASSPNQLWVEEHHKDGAAFDCTFTSEPYEWIWRKANEYFDNLWDKGRRIKEN
jgi:hypothetical protein